MERVVHIAKNHRQAREWDIRQVVEMTVEQRQAIAKRLKEKTYMKDTPDVKKSRSCLVRSTS